MTRNGHPAAVQDIRLRTLAEVDRIIDTIDVQERSYLVNDMVLYLGSAAPTITLRTGLSDTARMVLLRDGFNRLTHALHTADVDGWRVEPAGGYTLARNAVPPAGVSKMDGGR